MQLLLLLFVLLSEINYARIWTPAHNECRRQLFG